MKHWLFTQPRNTPLEWEAISNNVNNTSLSFAGENESKGRNFIWPVNIGLMDRNYTKYMDVPDNLPRGQAIRQFQKGLVDIAIKHHEGSVYISQRHIPPPLYDHTNSRSIDLEVLEDALEEHDWVSFGLILNDRQGFDMPTLMQYSEYIVRDKEYKLKQLEDGKLIEAKDNVRMLTFFVAYKLGSTGAYVLACNPSFLSTAGPTEWSGDNRTIHCGTDSAMKFALEPMLNCPIVANTVIVDKDELTMVVSRSSIISHKIDACLPNLQFDVKSSWDARIEGNTISVKHQLGMGYLKITFDYYDLAKPYITVEDRKITKEYLLLGV